MTDPIVTSHTLPSPDLSKLERDAAEIAAHARSTNTVRAYRTDWAHFSSWCRDMSLQALPALPRNVALYLTAHKDCYSMATLNRRLSSIAAAHRVANHPFDIRCREIALVMDGLRRTKTVRQRQVTALTTPLLRRTLNSAPETLTDRRNQTLVLVGMSAALRRSEIVALEVSDLTFSPEGVRIVIRRSKGDQFGEGQVIAIARTNSELCPVANLAVLMHGKVDEGWRV